MKNIITLFIAFGMFGVMSISFAEIDRRGDSFSENIVWSAYNELNSIDSLQFYKVSTKEGTIYYELLLSSETKAGKQIYSKEDAQIKVDGVMLSGKVLKIEYSNYDYLGDLSSVRIEISQDLASKIAKSQKVSLRFYADKGYTKTIDVPDNVLTEWKQVIATEK